VESVSNTRHVRHAVGAVAGKQADAGMQTVHAQVLEDVLHRVDKTYQAFFRRGKGFPRFKGKGWFDSFTYPQLGFNVKGSQISYGGLAMLKSSCTDHGQVKSRHSP